MKSTREKQTDIHKTYNKRITKKYIKKIIYIHITHIYNNIYTFDFVLLFLK